MDVDEGVKMYVDGELKNSCSAPAWASGGYHLWVGADTNDIDEVANYRAFDIKELE